MARYELDLTQAEQALKRTDELSKLLKKSLKEISQEFQQIGKTNVDASGKLIGYSDALEKRGVKSLKEFRREQTQQNYIIREGTQAITNMVFALGFLSQGQKGATSTTKDVTTALLTGVAAQNAIEFSMFSIGRAGAAMGGTIGRLAGNLSQYGGIIGIVVGVGAALFTLFDRSAEKAETAAKAQERLNKATDDYIRGIGKDQAQKELETLTKVLEGYKKELEPLAAKEGQHTVASYKQFVQVQNSVNAYQVLVDRLRAYIAALDQTDAVQRREANSAEALKKKREEMAAALKKVHDAESADMLAGLGADHEDVMLPDFKGLIPELEDQIKDLNLRIDVAGTEKEINDLLDERKAKQAELDRLTGKVNRNQEAFLQSLGRSFSELSAGLQSIGVKSDSLIGRLMSAVQFAIQLAKQIEAINKAKAAGEATGILGFLGPLGSILGIFGSFLGFQSGGFTGAGNASRPAGIVHRGEMVFEKPIVDRHLTDLSALRSLLQKGYTVPQATSQMAPAVTGRIRLRSLENEMRAVRLAIEELPNVMRLDPAGIGKFVSRDERRTLSKRF